MFKNLLKSTVVVVAVAAVAAQATLAAFTASATVTGNTFSTGTASLKLFKNLAGSATPGNLTQSLENTVDFNGIYPNWTQDYSVKLHNDGTVALVTSVNSAFQSGNASLGDAIWVQAYAWNDANSNGVVDVGEADFGAALNTGITLNQWLVSPGNSIPTGQVNSGETKGYVFRFTTADLDNSLQGTNVTYDFVFNGTTDGVITP